MSVSTHPSTSQLYTLSLHDALPIYWLDLGHVYSSGDVYTRTQGLSLSDRLTANSFRFDAGQQASVIDGRLNVSTLTGKAQGITVQQAISVDQMELDSRGGTLRSEEHTSELQSRGHLVCRLLLEKKKTN